MSHFPSTRDVAANPENASENSPAPANGIRHANDICALQVDLGHKHPAHRALHRVVTGSVQGFLALMFPARPTAGSTSARVKTGARRTCIRNMMSASEALPA